MGSRGRAGVDSSASTSVSGPQALDDEANAKWGASKATESQQTDRANELGDLVFERAVHRRAEPSKRGIVDHGVKDLSGTRLLFRSPNGDEDELPPAGRLLDRPVSGRKTGKWTQSSIKPPNNRHCKNST